MSLLKLTFIGGPAIISAFKRSEAELASQVRRNLVRSSALIKRSIQINLGGKVLKVRGGRLRQAVAIVLSGSGFGTIAKTGPQRIKYGAVHEFGAVIVPKTKKVLRFKIGGQWISAKRVVIPARPYVLPALEENLERITAIMGRSFGAIIG